MGTSTGTQARRTSFEECSPRYMLNDAGNADRFVVKAGDTQELFNATGPGVITHIWFTIAANSAAHLKELVLRMYWDGNAKPSVEVPVGDFFGLNLGQYQIFESAFVACSPGKSLNCYFAMPFRRSARSPCWDTRSPRWW